MKRFRLLLGHLTLAAAASVLAVVAAAVVGVVAAAGATEQRAASGGGAARVVVGCRTSGDVVCSVVRVPLDRTGHVPGNVVLHVQSLAAVGKQRGVMLLLAGGPGQAATSAFDLASYGAVWRLLFPGYAMIVFDARGSGRSGPLRCGGLEVTGAASPAAACARELGPRRDFYRTADSVEDIEAVRETFGFKRLSVWGTSYGTKVALAYAQSYPAQVDRLLLDSVVSPWRSDPFAAQLLRTIPARLASYCSGGACQGLTGNFAHDVVALANRLAAHPIHGTVMAPGGRTVTERVDGLTFLSLVLQTDLDPGLAAELPAVVHATRLGDPRPLLRLVALLEGPEQASGGVNNALYIATVCGDGPFPWGPGTPVAQRPALLRAAFERLPAGSFKQFGPWAAALGDADLCLHWPPSAAPAPPAGLLPDVPVLALSGGLDMRTPRLEARSVVARFPHGHLLAVSGVGHSVLTNAASICLIRAVHSWLNRGPVPTACSSQQLLAPIAAFPTARAARSPSVVKPPQTLADATATIRDAEAIWLLVLSEGGGRVTTIPGLDGGSIRVTVDGFTLKRYSLTPGLALSGTIRASFSLTGPASFDGRLSVAGANSSLGLLDLDRNGLSGSLAGAPVG